MTYNPVSLRGLGVYWMSKGGVNLGIVGDARHQKGYHLGRDRIYDGSGPGLGDRDYSVMTARDRAGLTDAASAIDLGRLDGSLPGLYRFSRWLVARCRLNAPGTQDIREVIYSPDGVKVLRWDRERGYRSAPREGEADASHLSHTHISYYRDSELRNKVPVFAAYWELPDTSTEDDMPVIVEYTPGLSAKIADPDGPANIRSAPSLTAPLLRAIPKGRSETWAITGWVKGETTDGSDQWIIRWAGGKWEYTHKTNVGMVVDPTPRTDADVAAAYERGKAAGDVRKTVTVTVSDGRPPVIITEV